MDPRHFRQSCIRAYRIVVVHGIRIAEAPVQFWLGPPVEFCRKCRDIVEAGVRFSLGPPNINFNLMSGRIAEARVPAHFNGRGSPRLRGGDSA